LTLTFDYLNLKLVNDREQMHGALPLEAVKNGGAPVVCRRRRRGGGGASKISAAAARRIGV